MGLPDLVPPVEGWKNLLINRKKSKCNSKKSFPTGLPPDRKGWQISKMPLESHWNPKTPSTPSNLPDPSTGSQVIEVRSAMRPAVTGPAGVAIGIEQGKE